MDLGNHSVLKYTSDLSEGEFLRRCSQIPYWYHTYRFDNGITKRGIYDIGRDIESYEFPRSLNNIRVLDVGPAGGWFSAYFSQRGASVTAADVRGYCDYDEFGRTHEASLEDEKPQCDRIIDGKGIYTSPSGEVFWLMQELLGLKIKFVNARVYDLSPTLFPDGLFDLVFLGSVLMHLRDPIGALSKVRKICRGRVIASTYCDTSLHPKEPAMVLRNWTRILWWVPNPKCLEAWFHAAGFKNVRISIGIQLSVDEPFIDAYGASHGKNQLLWRVEAEV